MIPSRYWRGEYFNNTDLLGPPALIRADRSINFDWGKGSPSRRIRADNFSARWTRLIRFPAGTYRFQVRVDDGARVFVDDKLVLNAWNDGAARDVVADVNLPGNHVVRVEYYERTGDALIRVTTSLVSPVLPQTTFPDWRGEYFNNPNLSGNPVLVRNDVAINFDWGNGSPGPSVNADNFSVRWARRQPFSAGAYRITITVDDGMRVYVDNALVLNEWFDGPPRTRSVDVNLTSGDHDLKVEYYDRGGGAVATFSIAPAPAPTPTAVP